MIEEKILPTQVWIPRLSGSGPPTAKKMALLSPDDHAGWGKPSGGLWTSTWATHEDIGWFGWCASEQPDWLNDHAYLLRPVECRVWMLADKEDLHQFHERYATPLFPDSTHREILSATVDWSLVLRDCDAVHLSDAWLGKGHLHFDLSAHYSKWGHCITFAGWDAESTWWSRWLFSGRARRVPLEDIRCLKCAGSGWARKPDWSKGFLAAGGLECPACEGSGRRSPG